MQTVLIVVHLMIVLALVAVVLLQRSEGGGLGIGGGGGGNFMSSRGSGNALTRITGVLAAAFFVTSLTLGILARYEQGPSSILDRIETETQGTGEGILDQLGPAPTTNTAPDDAGDLPSAPDAADTAPAGGTNAVPAESAPADEAPAANEIPTGQ